MEQDEVQVVQGTHHQVAGKGAIVLQVGGSLLIALPAVWFLVLAIDALLSALFQIPPVGFVPLDSPQCRGQRLFVGGIGFAAIGVGLGLLSAHLLLTVPRRLRVGASVLLLAAVAPFGDGDSDRSIRLVAAVAVLTALSFAEPTRNLRVGPLGLLVGGLVASGVVAVVFAGSVLPCR